MITLQIDTNDTKKIEEFLKLAINHFDFNIKITNDNTHLDKNHISSYIDQKIRNSKSTKSKKSKQFKNAIEGLSDLMDMKKAKLSLNQVKESYFDSKVN